MSSLAARYGIIVRSASRNGRRWNASLDFVASPVPAIERVRGFFVALQRAGVRARLHIAWNRSFHDAHFALGILYGDAVRHPQGPDDAAQVVERALERVSGLFERSRAGGAA